MNVSVFAVLKIFSGSEDLVGQDTLGEMTMPCFIPVSYTHLDVYKRQDYGRYLTAAGMYPFPDVVEREDVYKRQTSYRAERTQYALGHSVTIPRGMIANVIMPLLVFYSFILMRTIRRKPFFCVTEQVMVINLIEK